MVVFIREVAMPMFSFDKSSYEFNLLNLLQDRFFKTSKRNKILAKWAAGRLGLRGNDSAGYVRSIIFLYLVSPHDRKIVEKISEDFKNSQIPVTESDIWKKIKSIENRIDNKAKMMGNNE